MKNKTYTIFLSCTIGAGMGFLIANNIGIFWLLGILLGAFIAYIIYDPVGFVKTIPLAFKSASSYCLSTQEVKEFLLSLDHNFKYFGPNIIWIFTIYFNLVNNTRMSQDNVCGLVSCLYVLSIIVTSITYTLHKIKIDEDTLENEKVKPLVSWLGMIYIARIFIKFPVVLNIAYYLTPITFLLYAVNTVIVLIYKFIKFTVLFFWKLFKIIHTEERLLVGTDAFIGGYVGHHFDNVILGMIIGGVWGVINFRIIAWLLIKYGYIAKPAQD